MENASGIRSRMHNSMKQALYAGLKRRATGVAITLLISLGATVESKAAGFEILRPHRAVYEIKLKQAAERSGIESMSGRIVYEMAGNECDGISVRYRFVSRVNANGEIFTTDQQTSSFESADGGEYTFLTKNFVNEQLDRTIKGVARKQSDSLLVELDQPEEDRFELPNANFISTHLVEVIERAREGRPFFKMRIFDGGDGGDQTLTTSNVIGPSEIVEDRFTGETEKAIDPLKAEAGWPVTIGYFKDSLTDLTEAMPIYEVSFILYEGGVSRRLTMNYPDYSLTGTLVDLEYLDQAACTIEN